MVLVFLCFEFYNALPLLYSGVPSPQWDSIVRNAMELPRIKLDCALDDPKEIVKHQAAALAACSMFSSYTVTRKIVVGVGPESFAESWMKTHLVSSNSEFEDLVVGYFGKILSELATKKKSE